MTGILKSGSLIALNGWTTYGSYINGSNKWRSIDIHTLDYDKCGIGLYVGPDVDLENWKDMFYIRTYTDPTWTLNGEDLNIVLHDGTKANVRGALFKLISYIETTGE